MKLLAGFLLMTLCFTTFSSCEKLLSESCMEEESPLTGKWQFVEQYVSIGGTGNWNAVVPGGQTIEFKKDGKFTASAGFQKEANRYEVLDNNRIKISPVPGESGSVILFYTFSNSQNELQLSPLEPSRCIEGCASKFLRN